MTETSIKPVGFPLPCVHDELALQRSARVLLGWLPPTDAVRQLLGRGPQPPDDLTAINRMISNARSAVSARPATAIADPVVAGDRAIIDEVAKRPEVRTL